MRKKLVFILTALAAALLTAIGLSACEHWHSFGKWEIAKEATCTENGLRIATCSCGEVRTEVIYAGHIEVIDRAVEASCTVEGLTEGKHCSRCGEILVPQENLGVKHDIVVREGVPATCFATGLTDEEYCTICEEVLTPQTLIKMLPHTFEAGFCTECNMPVPSEGITYRPVYENGEITSYYVFDGEGCVDADVVIADSYEGLPVVAVGNSAFSGSKSVETVYFPKSIQSIGDSAFFACENLTEVTLYDDLKSIGDNAFAKCSRLKKVELPASLNELGMGAFWDCTSLFSISIPDGIAEMKEFSFYGCARLTSVSLGDGLKNVGNRAFACCTSLYEIVFPEGLETIGDRAFGTCSALKRVTLPKSIKEIGKHAFEECDSLVEICNGSSLELEAGSEEFGGIAAGVINLYTPEEGESRFTVTDDGFLFYEDEQGIQLVGYLGEDSEIILPEDFRGEKYAIAIGAIGGVYSSVKSVTVTGGVERIEAGAFGAGGAITAFYYLGSVDDWLALPKEDFWEYLTGFNEVECSDGVVTRDGNIIVQSFAQIRKEY